MTPLAPLRMLLTSFLGLFVLGLGAYCLWRYANEYQRPQTTVVTDIPPETSLQVDEEGPMVNAPATDFDSVVNERTSKVTTVQPDIPPWVFLTVGSILISLSLFGRWPLMWMARLTSAQPHSTLAPTREAGMFVDRPDGTRLHVEICGKLDGPTVVFTHGWSLDSTSWHYAKTLLGDRFRLVLWDLPGLGRSRASNDCNFEISKMADDLHAVLSSLGDSRPVYLAGHSIGGMISQIYCGKYNDTLRQRVAGIVLVHTTYTNPLRTMLGAPLWKAVETILILPMQYVSIALAPLFWLSNWHSYFNGSMQMTTRLTSFTGKQSFQQLDYAAWISSKAWPGYIARGNLAMFRYDSQAALREIDVPLLAICGDHDRITKPEASKRISELVAGSELLRNAGGHLAIFEFNHEVMAGIAKFVDKHENSRIAVSV